MPEYRSLLDILIEHVGKPLPEGYDSWGFKTVDGLRQTRNSFQWPAVGGVVSSWDDNGPHAENECPARPGDGLTIALTAHAACSGGLPLAGLLLVAYRSEDVLASLGGKVRTSGDVTVVSEALIRLVNLSGADLSYADLRGAHLGGADLSRAHLGGADLGGADLSRAHLGGAYLHGASLRGADLSDADGADNLSERGVIL